MRLERQDGPLGDEAVVDDVSDGVGGAFRLAVACIEDRPGGPRAVNGLKFDDVLPEDLATATLAARLSDLPGAAEALRIRRYFTTDR